MTTAEYQKLGIKGRVQPGRKRCIANTSALTIAIPIRVVSEANRRDHWRVRHARFKNQRQAVTLVLGNARLPALPVRVVLTRCGPKRMDTDNLAGAFKAVRDEIASQYRTDDGSEQFEWLYQQERGRYGVRIMIERRSGGEWRME